MKQVVHDYIAELRSSPLKSGTIALLLVVGMLLWGRLLLKEVPRTASAIDEMTLAQWEASQGKASKPARGGLSGQVFLPLPADKARNLFVLDPSRYKRTVVQTNTGGSAKYPATATEEELRAAVIEAAQELDLTTVIEGDDPVAIINGQLVRPGHTVEGFTLQRIDGRSVILEQGGTRVRKSL